MTKVVVPNQFLDLLASSELIDRDRLDRLAEELDLAKAASAKDAAKILVKAGVLTIFQAERLLHGRYRGFFIDHYKVLDLLGSGGMGSIFIAEDRKSGEKVALKVLNEAAKNDAGMLARFELEADAGTRLNHPDIVRTFKVDQTSHVAYVVMEFVEGINLHELTVLHGTKSWPQVCDFMLQAARGLHHAHQHGIVHRDVKPSNLLVSTDGRVRILDFGLALLDGRDNEDEFSLAMIFGHDCLGTCDYMPPEQAKDSHQVDARADIYSLGCTFYYALTGTPPFVAGTNSEKLKAHREQTVPDVRENVPDVPMEVAGILRRMMAKMPKNRFDSMAEVVARLSPFAKRAPVEFDFQRVIRIRANDTKRRMARERKEQQRSAGRSSLIVGGTETGSTMSGVLSDGALKASSRASTIVGGETSASPHRPEEFVEEAPSAAASAMAIAERFTEIPADYRLISPSGDPIPLSQQRLVAGREVGCDVHVPVKGVSGRHCEFEFIDGAWVVRDLGSRNGTTVNGVPLTEDRRLMHGDRIVLAQSSQFRFENLAFTAKSGSGRMTAVIAAILGLALLGGVLWWLVG